MVTKACSLLIACSKIHKLSILHTWECDDTTRNVVKKLANQNPVICLLDMIGKSDMLGFMEQRKIYAQDTEDCQERRIQDVAQFRS